MRTWNKYIISNIAIVLVSYGCWNELLQTSWMKQQKCIPSQSGGPKSKIVITGRKSRCQQGFTPPGGSSKDCFLPLQLQVAACVPWLVDLSLQSLLPWSHWVLPSRLCHISFSPYDFDTSSNVCVFSMPPSSSMTPECQTVQLNSDTTYLEIASDPKGKELSPIRLSLSPNFRSQFPSSLLPVLPTDWL